MILVDNTIFALESVGKIRKWENHQSCASPGFPPCNPLSRARRKWGAYVKLVVSEMTDRCGLIVKHMGYVRLLLELCGRADNRFI